MGQLYHSSNTQGSRKKKKQDTVRVTGGGWQESAFQIQQGSHKYELKAHVTTCPRRTPDKTPAQREGRHDVPPPADEFLAVGSFWEGK